MSEPNGSGGGSSSALPLGERFGRWVVVGEAPRRNSREMWIVLCACGVEAVRQADSIRRGASTGCVKCASRSHARKHERNTREHRREYKSYRSMLDRCYDPSARWYRRYGGRGIGVCDAWRDSFDAFMRDVGPCPGAGYSIDRIDNDRGYEPGNVRWATAKQQARNTRRNHVIEIDGEARCIAEWAELLGVRPQIISTRISRGWSERDAVLVPVVPAKRRAA